jgi:hypothetical protein
MARLAVGMVFGIVVGVLGGAALGIHADDEVEAAALEAHVDPQDLAGAVATTGVGPREYLRGVGELPVAASTPPGPADTRASSVSAESNRADSPAVSTVWAALAGCESTGRWNANTGNGYYGGLQQDLGFWRRYGGLAYAPRPDLATPSAQVVVAQRGQAVQGWAAWPACSRRLGLR